MVGQFELFRGVANDWSWHMLQTGLHAWLHKVDDSGETPLGLAVAAGNIKSVHVVRAKLARLANPGSTIIDVAPGWDQHLKGDSIVQLELPA